MRNNLVPPRNKGKNGWNYKNTSNYDMYRVKYRGEGKLYYGFPFVANGDKS